MYLPFTDIECTNNDTFLRAINVVGAEFTINGELNDLGVEENNVIFEQIFDNLDLETDTCDLVHNIQPENDLSPTTSNVTQHNNGKEQVNDSINENSLTIIPDANENKINEENANRNALNTVKMKTLKPSFMKKLTMKMNKMIKIIPKLIIKKETKKCA